MNPRETIQRIVASSGKSEGEVKKLINEKKEKFAGLLTETGAALMVAKELGVELGIEKKPLERLTISQLRDGMNNVELLVRVKHVFSPKRFEKGARKGVLCNLIVGDSSGETRLTVWGKDVERLQELGVERGCALLLKNCYVKSYKGAVQLNLSYNGGMEVVHVNSNELPEATEKLALLKELSGNESDVSVVARVMKIFPEIEFEKAGSKGKLINFLLGDGTAVIRATAWHEMVEEVKELKAGEAIKIEGAYTRDGLNGVELQLGFRARVLRNPKRALGLPNTVEIQGLVLKEKAIAELLENDRFIQLNAVIRDVFPGKLCFNVCSKCGRKVEAMENSFLCEQCGEVGASPRAVVSLLLGDESGEIKAVLFGEVAEKTIGFGISELRKRLEASSADQVIAELREKLVGKKAKANGFVKKSPFSNELEFNVRELELI